MIPIYFCIQKSIYMNWFKKYSRVYMPIQAEGVVVTFLAVLFMIPVIMTTIRNGDTVSDDFYKIFVYGIYTAFWWKWIVEKTSNS